MILRSFASNLPYTLSFPIVIVIAVYLIPDPASIPFMMAGYSSEYLMPASNGWAVTANILLILAGGFMANRLFNQNEFMNTPVYTPALLYTIVMTTTGMIQTHIPTGLANILIIAGMGYQLKIFKQPSIIHEAVTCGFLYGSAALIVPSLLTLLPAVLIGILINRPFHVREIVLTVLAFAIPFGYWAAIAYLVQEQPDYILIQKTLTLNASQYLITLPWPVKVFALLLFVSLILALRQFTKSERNSNRAKSTRTTTVLMALAVVTSFFLNSVLTGQWVLQSIAFPVSFIIAYWFAHYRNSVLAPFFFYAICLVSFLLSFRLL